MLQFLRKRSQSLVIQIIVVVIALVFIFWGVGTNLMNRQDSAITVNGATISFQEFQKAYDQTYTRLAQQFGGTIPKGLADSLNIRQQVINQLVRDELLRQGGIDMGIMVSGREIQEEIRTMPQFQENGAFNLERYQSILASNRLSPTAYEDTLRHDLLASKTLSDLSGFALSSSENEIRDLYNLENETVSVDFAIVSPQDYIEGIEVDEPALEEWFKNAGSNYQTEAEVNLVYLPFSYGDTASKITVDEQEIAAWYDSHRSDYLMPEQRHARHILLKAAPDAGEAIHEQQRIKAEKLLEQLQNGEDFISLARTNSEGPTAPEGGDLGFFSRGQMVKAFEDAVFSMAVGDISPVVKTDYGYHIIKLEEIRPARVVPLAEVHDEIAAKIQLSQAQPIAFQAANATYEGIINAGSLDAYLEAHPETVVKETGFFKKSAPPEGMASDRTFLERAFSLKKGELSSLIEVNDGYAIISALDVREPHVPELTAVREEAEKDYRLEKATEKAQQAAEKLIADLNSSGSGFDDVVANAGLQVQHSGKLARQATDSPSSFPQQLVETAFRLTEEQPVHTEPALVDGDYYVFKLVDRAPPETEMSDTDRKRYAEMLQQFKSQQIVDSWLSNQQAEADIFIHSSLQNF